MLKWASMHLQTLPLPGDVKAGRIGRRRAAQVSESERQDGGEGAGALCEHAAFCSALPLQ